MSAETFFSDRTFQLWRTVVNHSQLLLRSNPTAPGESRVEILFKAVAAINLKSSLDGIRVEAASVERSRAIGDDIGVSTEYGMRIFLVNSSGFNGYVAAVSFFTDERFTNYADRSHLLVDPDNADDPGWVELERQAAHVAKNRRDNPDTL